MFEQISVCQLIAIPFKEAIKTSGTIGHNYRQVLLLKPQITVFFKYILIYHIDNVLILEIFQCDWLVTMGHLLTPQQSC